MKKYIKKIVIGISVLVLLIMLIGMSTGLKFKYETGKMKPLETQNVIDHIYVVRNDYVNFYLIKSNQGYIAVDAGLNSETSVQELKKLDISPEEVTAVLLTHTDSDHTACLKLFTKAKIYLSAQEEQMINGQTHRQLQFNNSISVPYVKVKDGEVLALSDLKAEGILTPGHTPGSMSYIINDKYLFTGDTLSLKDGNAQCFNNYFNMDTKIQEESLHQLAARKPAEYIFTGHYGFTNDYQEAFKKWQ